MTDVEHYIEAIADNDRKERFRSILELIRALYPTATESMRYKMPTFEYESGWISVANRKNYISVYTCMPDHIAEFKARHPKIPTGKGCINFRDKDEMPLSDLEQVIQRALEYQH
jgi:uncharacterized protein YdhG (YjbR/CyaY superfamily)